MRKTNHLLCNPWNMTALLVSLLCLSDLSMARSYLQEVENEAAATVTNEPSNNQTDKPDWTPQKASLIERIDPGLNKGQFEESLKSRFYGSYLFYSALNSQKQQHVYEEYLNNNDIAHLRDTIKNAMTQ